MSLVVTMEERDNYEKLSIRDSARSSRKYGSTSSRNNTKTESYVKHKVSSTDTLQGLSLKYSVTTEQIRRANRLYATDSLFLREFLLIPINDNEGSMSPTAEDLPTSPLTYSGSSSQLTSPSTSHLTSPSDCEDLTEFLVKIDASIANTKADVNKIHKKSQFSNDGELGIERRKPAMSRLKQTSVNNNGAHDILKTPHAVVMTQGNRIKTSMHRYQQQQDELFEL